MLKNRKQLYQIYHTMIAMALSWALMLVINQFYHMRVLIVWTVVFSFIFSVVVLLFDINKKNVITYLLLAGMLPVLALIFFLRKQNPLNYLRSYYDWYLQYNGGRGLYWAPGAYFTMVIVTLLVAILFYIVTKNQMAKTVLAVLILVSMLILCFNRINISKVVVGISIFYIMTVVAELYGYAFGRNEGKQGRKEGILYLAPVCLLIAVLSVGFPSKAEPVKWTLFKNIYSMVKVNIQSQLDYLQTDLNYYFGKSKGEFFLSMTGYSDDNGNLDNGALTPNDKIAMKVSGLTRMDTVYLTGSVSNIYTGSSWESSEKDYLPGEQDYLLDYSELFFCMSRQNDEMVDKNRFVKMKAIDIFYKNIMTKTLFYPLKLTYLDIPDSQKKLSEDSSKITFKKAHGKGTSYKSIYYEMNLNDGVFQNILRNSDSFTYDKAPAINLSTAQFLQKGIFSRDNIDTLLNRKDIYRVLGERAKRIEAEDTGLPPGLPDRVRKLAYKITDGYTTKYDKLKAIEKYLLNYKYTLEPKKAPEGEDFVDYFLFESKEGYCTSFATAMAVLGRCVGIPTRYVEGFVVNGKYGTGRDVCEVKDSQAHAWAEAYIEGVGWIPFEATASYYDQRYVQWPESKKYVSVSAPVVDRSNYYANMQRNLYQPFKSDIKVRAKKKTANEIGNILLIILTVLICAALAVLIYYYFMKRRFKKVYGRGDEGDRMYLLFLQILRVLKLEGFTLEPQETILMLVKRVKGHYRFENITFKEVADIFMRYRYAEAEITEKELEKVDRYRLGLVGKRREEVSGFKLWLEEFIFLIQINRQLRRRYNNT